MTVRFSTFRISDDDRSPRYTWDGEDRRFAEHGYIIDVPLAFAHVRSGNATGELASTRSFGIHVIFSSILNLEPIAGARLHESGALPQRVKKS